MCFVDRWSVHISWMWTLNIIFTSVMLNGKHWTFEPLNIRYCDMMPHAPCLCRAAPPCAWQMDCRWTFNSWMWTFDIRNRHTSNIEQSAANIWYQKLKSNEQQTSDMLPLYRFQESHSIMCRTSRGHLWLPCPFDFELSIYNCRPAEQMDCRCALRSMCWCCCYCCWCCCCCCCC